MDHEVRIGQGEETGIVVEKIWGKNDGYYIPTIEEILELDEDYELFRNGVIAHAKKCGYSGQDDDMSALAKFLRNRCAQANAEIGDKTIYNWLNEDAAPSTNEKSRENIYKLCFALGMDDRETELFFLKNYLTRPYNYKNVNEAVYCFCLKQGLSYTKAQEIVERVHAAPEKTCEEDRATALIGDDIRKITDENELVGYLSQHYYTKEQYHNKAYQRLDELRASCTDYFNAQLESGALPDYDLKEIDNLNHLIYVLYNINNDEDRYRHEQENKKRDKEERQKFRAVLANPKREELPKSITRSWPSNPQLQSIEDRTASDEVIRKALIMLSFVEFCTQVELFHLSGQEKDTKNIYDEFIDNIDEVLEECGYVGLYPRNPFDWLFFNFVRYDDPLSVMQEFIAYAFKGEEVGLNQ